MTENINLTDALKKYFGFDTFKGNQEAIIRNHGWNSNRYISFNCIDEKPGGCHA